MSFYGSRITHFVEAKNEEELRKKLLLVGQQLNQKLEVINVYHNSAKNIVVAWYFHDVKAAPLPKPEVKKTTKKKVTKKAK